MPSEFVPWTHETNAIFAMAGVTATTMKHDWLGTEHIMIVLIRDSVISCAIQGYFDLDPQNIYQKLMNLMEKQERRIPVRLEPPRLTPRTQKAIFLAGRIAMNECGSNSIKPMHLFLGILREEDGLAARLLKNEFKLTYAKALEKIINVRSVV